MKIEVIREASNKDCTFGKLYINGKFYCNTLEDVQRDVKIKGETAIPKGTYAVTLRNAGGKNEKYKEKFASAHFGMLYLNNIPNYEYVLIHIGNTKKDSEGCILVGLGKDIKSNSITQSTDAYKLIYPIIAKALLNKEKVEITVK